MIFQHKIDYTFPKPILKIHYYAPAFDDSIALIAQKGIGEDYLLHYNKHSQLEYKHEFKEFVDSMSMPNDKEVVVLRPEEDFIYIFDLQHKRFIKIKHNYFSQISCQNEAHYFCDTKLLCIRQNGDHQQVQMSLTYYQWPHIKDSAETGKTAEPVVSFLANEEEWNPSFQVRKLNSHSKYGWCEARHKGEFQVRIHQIIDGKGVYRRYKIEMLPLYQPYGMAQMQAAIVEMWEYNPGVLLLFTSTSKNQHNAINPQTHVVNNTFLWDLKLEYIRQTKVVLPPQYHDLQVDIFGTPTLSMFRTFFFEPGRAVPSPAFFVQNQKEQIIKEEEWICSHLQKYTVLERNRDSIVEGIFENSQVSTFSMRIISLMVRKELSMFMLKNMKVQPAMGWDCDTLIDIFKMLDYEENK